MKNALTGRPDKFSKWMGLSVSLILAAMAALIFLARVAGHTTGSQSRENSRPDISNGALPPLDSAAPNPKRFNF
jgi:hypothetical protein